MHYVVTYHDKKEDCPRLFLPHNEESLLKALPRIVKEHKLLGVTSHENETPLLTCEEEFESDVTSK